MATKSNPPSFIQSNGWNFLITDAPHDDNLVAYLKQLKKHNVHNVVRACDPSYATEKLKKKKIDVHDMPFPDGGFPPEDVIKKWIELCHKTFGQQNGSGEKEESIAVHCVAGLGRAPVLVAIALMERGILWQQAVEIIREKRTGAINNHQLQTLKHFKTQKTCVLI